MCMVDNMWRIVVFGGCILFGLTFSHVSRDEYLLEVFLKLGQVSLLEHFVYWRLLVVVWILV